jgi:formate hydrogenlyase subunit 3/multisubunit Na+/H+ antiporter MnhD subunit
MTDVTLAIALPLLGAFLLPLPLGRGLQWLGGLLGPAVLALSAIVLFANASTYEAPYAIAMGGFAPPLGISFYVDPLALVFALSVPLVTLLLWPGGDGEAGIRRQSLTLLLAAALTGLALSGDLFNLYVFYELAAVASYGLAAGSGSSPGFVAAFRYLLISALGSVFGLMGIALIYFQTGTLNLAHLSTLGAQLANPQGLAAFAMLVIGFGVKAELFPVNGWVPEVYGAASKRVAGLLAGIISKLALLIILRGTQKAFGWSVFDAGYTFASKIAAAASEFNDQYKAGAYIAAGLVLFVLTFVVNSAARAAVAGRGHQ